MSAAAISKAQIGAIHALKAKAGLDDEAYRDLLAGTAGVSSSKLLTSSEAIRVIDRLKVLSGDRPKAVAISSKAQGALDLSGPYAGIARALWISAWNLGVVEHREDTALVAFVRRQTGIDHLNWVRDHADGHKVVEALKAWLAREAGVAWPKKPTAMGPGRTIDLRKLAVVAAQLRLLGRVETIDPADDLDATMKRLGIELRRRAG